jgi:hypothetical protein
VSLASQILALATRIGQEIKQVRLELAAAGGGRIGQATVDFGVDDNDLISVTIAAPWVGASSKIVCSPAYETTPEHDPEDAQLEGLTVTAGNIVPGASFDLIAFAPESTFGTYKINWQGA